MSLAVIRMALHHTSDSALAKAVRKAGGQTALSRLIGCPQTTINTWLKRNWPVAPEYVLKTEEVTGVSRHDLRPDLYPREGANPTPAAQPLIDQGLS